MSEREKLIQRVVDYLEDCDWTHLTCGDAVFDILRLETDTLRLAIIKKEPVLPDNSYPAGFRTIYGNTQKSMLRTGFVQEVKDES